MHTSILPGGEDYAPVVSAVIAEELDRARQLVTFGASLVSSDTRQFSTDEIVTYKLATSMVIGAIKTLQSVCCTAENGAGHDVTTLTRSLFETAMAIQFVLRDEVEIPYRDGLHKPPRIVRARMVLAHEPRLKLDRYEQNCKVPAIAAVMATIPAETIREVRLWAAETESELAPEWLKRMDEYKYGYCGKRVREIAGFLERPNDVSYREIYQGLYNDMSKPAHGMSFIDHVKTNADCGSLSTDWHCDPRLLIHKVDLAALFVTVSLKSLSEFCGYAPSPATVLDEFARWFADSQQDGDKRRPQVVSGHEPI